MNTNDLIANLANKATTVKPMKKPSYLILQFLGFSVIYYTLIQPYIGIRGDIFVKFSQPFFAIEITLILLLFLSCLIAAVLTIYPDNYQKTFLLKFPYLVLALLVVFFSVEIFTQNQENSALIFGHSYQCSLCVASFAVIPALYFFYILHKGANLNPFQGGAFAAIAASSLSAIALRIGEANDSFSHFVIWHYLPILVFSLIGAFLGKQIFKW